MGVVADGVVLDMADGVVLGAVVVPVLVGVVVVVLGAAPVVPVGVDAATAPAAPVLVEGAVGAASVSGPVPATSEPHPNNASAMTAQRLALRRGARRDTKPFVWPLSVEFNISKSMSSLQGPATPQVID